MYLHIRCTYSTECLGDEDFLHTSTVYTDQTIDDKRMLYLVYVLADAGHSRTS